ncbi:Aste57867_288 [Aphanomyces stellatus]|uniref:Aste57867_288 protein n=1 Tax=Aphanomyces stellatus TaxID=120398 RepID=A0A485K3E1_9STRA|nr:hypothetical protein As57867_000288 [Aphanomyces stellatus]VFT77514.1 Aste57867_288 [Aphanomyces stellatus]
MGASQFKAATPADIAKAVRDVGGAYAAYESGILANGVGGDVLCSLDMEQLPMLFSTIGVTNTIHQAKLAALFREHRPSLLMRTLTSARLLDAAFNNPSGAKAFDCFLSHDWGQDSENRDNHKRVAKVNAFLKERGVRSWFDEEQMGGNIVKAMANGIEESSVALIFVTHRYQTKVNGDNANDNCQLEFGMTKCTQTPARMLPVVMEPAMKSLANWSGQFKMVLGNLLYQDLSMDDDTADFDQSCHALLDRIVALLVKPPGTSREPSPSRPPSIEGRSSCGSMGFLGAPSRAGSITGTRSASVPEIDPLVHTNEWVQAWLAIEPSNLDGQNDALQDMLEHLEPPVPIHDFPVGTLVLALATPALQDAAAAVCALLLETSDAAPRLLAEPGFLDHVVALLPDDAALVILCNLSVDAACVDILLAHHVPAAILVSDELPVVAAIDVMTNLAAFPAARASLVASVAPVLAWLRSDEAHADATARLLLNLSADAACTTALLAHGILTELQKAPRGLKLLGGLCRHGDACAAVAGDELWMDYLVQVGAPSLPLVARLSHDHSDALLPHAATWISLWCSSTDDEHAWVALVNVSSKNAAWRQMLESHADVILTWVETPSPHQAKALKLVANLIALPSMQARLRSLRPTIEGLLLVATTEMYDVVVDILDMLNETE